MANPPAELPGRLQRWIEEFVAGDSTDAEGISAALVEWADGRPAEDVQGLLDHLRTIGAYPLSLIVLEEAWNAEVPLDLAGRIAEDWVGTVLHGIGDRAGAAEVAQHLVKGALARGPAFAGDLGHLFLDWRLFEAADPLIREAAQAHPGDTALRFNLGVVHKIAQEWAAAKGCFEQVLRHHGDDKATRWNLGVVCTALADWPGARAAWEGLGFTLPPGEGDFGSPGEPTAVEVGNEVLWGLRLCPARVELRTLPYGDQANFGDVLLIDGVSLRKTPYPDGSEGPILPVLAVLHPAGTRTHRIPVDSRQAAKDVAARLNQAGHPAADWSAQAGLPMVAVGQRAEVDDAAFKAALEQART
jgi:tetratricopeptide (TPR) repeat protein